MTTSQIFTTGTRRIPTVNHPPISFSNMRCHTSRRVLRTSRQADRGLSVASSTTQVLADRVPVAPRPGGAPRCDPWLTLGGREVIDCDLSRWANFAHLPKSSGSIGRYRITGRSACSKIAPSARLRVPEFQSAGRHPESRRPRAEVYLPRRPAMQALVQIS